MSIKLDENGFPIDDEEGSLTFEEEDEENHMDAMKESEEDSFVLISNLDQSDDYDYQYARDGFCVSDDDTISQSSESGESSEETSDEMSETSEDEE